MPTVSASQIDKPLRHSIAAILESRQPPLSPCTYNTDRADISPGVCYLPHTAVVSDPVHASRTSDDVRKRADVPDCVGDAQGCRRTSTTKADAEAVFDTEEVVVVDENDDVTVILAKGDGCPPAEGKETEKALPSPPPYPVKNNQKPLLSYSLTNGPLAYYPPLPSEVVRNHSAHTTGDSVLAVRSAFRPIVRPWVAGGITKKTVEPFSSVSTKSFKNVKSVPWCPARNGHRVGEHPARLPAQNPSLDAIVTFRKQGSVFPAVCGLQQVGSRNHVTQRSSGDAPSGAAVAQVACGHPMATSLASWFSWLQARGLQLGSLYHHSHLQQHQHQHPQRQPHHGLQPPFQHQALAPALSCHQAPRFNCEACGKSYSTFGGLSKHKQFHCAAQVKKDFRCKFCDKNYSSLGALKMHIRTHTLPCKCGVCGKAFSRPWLLQGHVRTHTGEKPFTCPHCARAFADRSNLRAHLQTHSDVKKYSCRACSKTFSRMSLLTKHRESSCVAFQR